MHLLNIRILLLGVFIAFLPKGDALANVTESTTTNIFNGITSRIVGGINAPKDRYTWIARSIEKNGNWDGCSGNLIAADYVLTAAHCIHGNMKGYQVGALCPGYKEGSNCNQHVEFIEIDKKIVHPEYKSHGLHNDFALVKLKRSSSIHPVNIDNGSLADHYVDGEKMWVAGFGLTEEGGRRSNHLKHVDVGYISNSRCVNDYGYTFHEIKDNMLCAAGQGKDACQGDSGGPLWDEESNTLVGLVSWGFGCASKWHPGVYSRISKGFSWIKDNVCKDYSSNMKPDWCRTGDREIDWVCEDSNLDLVVNNELIPCSIVRENQSLCSISGVRSHCKLACNNCAVCSDSKRHFVINNKRRRRRRCRYVQRKPEKRCRHRRFLLTCQRTCGYCSNNERK